MKSATRFETSPVYSERSRKSRYAPETARSWCSTNRVAKFLRFLDGRPVFVAAALTGESLGEKILRYVFDKAVGHGTKLEEKLTPAGPYTVKREMGPDYGTIFTIDEIQGKDRDIAIHRVALVPGEYRPERLRSQNAADRRITNGCINVERDTIRFLERNVTGGRTPLYILPRDASRTLAFFGWRPPCTDAPGDFVRPSTFFVCTEFATPG
jgi:hypothetical protein